MEHYRALGLEPGADAAAVRAAYRDAVRRWHPDRDPSPAAAQRFLAAQEAYEVLGDPARRATYDGSLDVRAAALVRVGTDVLARTLRRLARGGRAVWADIAERRRDSPPPPNG